MGTGHRAGAVEQALRRSGPVKAVAIVHAETSTGAWQPLEAIAHLCRDHDTLFLSMRHIAGRRSGRD
jgi:Serine-pyruvate aminotransferase/archaeal aspartate aminotransferase